VTGRNVQTGSGKISSSVGQIAYLRETGSGGSLNDGIQQAFTITFEVQEKESIELSVFPNPTHEAIFIETLSSSMKKHVEVFSEDRRKVLENTFLTQRSLLQLNELTNGVYMISVTLDTNENMNSELSNNNLI